MEPYYSRDGIVVYLGDCGEVLPHLRAKSHHLLVTDPPYGVSYKSNYGGNFTDLIGDSEELRSLTQSLIGESAKAIASGRHAYVFGPPSLLPPPFTAVVDLIWDKCVTGMGDLSLPWGPAHEPITFAVLRRDSEKGRGNLAARLRAGSILRYPRPAAIRHPTEKPVPCLRRLIESSSWHGEAVLDPFLGVGSTLVAAIAEGRVGTGIELDEGYAEIACTRIDDCLDKVKALGREFLL